MARYMLTTRAQMAGAIREPGFVFELKDGELGPHRTIVAGRDGVQPTGAGQMVDVPLYVEYKEPEEKPGADTKPVDAKAASTKPA